MLNMNDFFFYTCFCPSENNFPWENSGRFPQGKPAATESRYLTLINYKVHAGSFSCFHNPPNSDMDYTRSSTCARDHSYACAYTRGVAWAHRQRVSTTFLTRGKKLSQIVLVLFFSLLFFFTVRCCRPV